MAEDIEYFFECIAFVYLVAILLSSLGVCVWGGGVPQKKKIQTQTAWKCCNFSSLQGFCLGPVKNGGHGPGRVSKVGIIEQEEEFPVPNGGYSVGCQ